MSSRRRFGCHSSSFPRRHHRFHPPLGDPLHVLGTNRQLPQHAQGGAGLAERPFVGSGVFDLLQQARTVPLRPQLQLIIQRGKNYGGKPDLRTPPALCSGWLEQFLFLCSGRPPFFRPAPLRPSRV